MGTYRSGFVGPWAKIKCLSEEIPVIEKIKTCTDTNCKNHGKRKGGDFCGLCGSKFIKQSFTSQVKIIFDFNEFNFENEFEDEFNLIDGSEFHSSYGLANSVILLSNKRCETDLKYNSDALFVDFSKININEKIESFKIRNKTYFDLLGAKIGLENITYGYGCLDIFR